MTVVFNKTLHFSPDGLVVEKYEVGKPYTSRSAQEERMFQHYLDKGDATEYLPQAIEETKVVKPKERK
jgi:hypothetical protein